MMLSSFAAKSCIRNYNQRSSILLSKSALIKKCSSVNKSNTTRRAALHSSTKNPKAISVPLSESSSSNMSSSSSSHVPQPSTQQLKSLFIASAIPMIGFGFMDNFIMVQSAGYIDSTLGTTLGIATLTAAALGQVVSDVSGVLFGGTIERMLQRFRLVPATTSILTTAQRQLPRSKNVALAGSVVGVILGCLLGASSLLFVDLDASERRERAVKLREVVAAMLADDFMIPSEECNLYLLLGTTSLADDVTSKNTTTTSTSSSSLQRRLTTLTSTAKRQQQQQQQHGPQIRALESVGKDSLVAQCGHSQSVISYGGQGLYVPVVHEGETWGVLEFRNKLMNEKFTEFDEKLASTMARHLAIFIDRLSD